MTTFNRAQAYVWVWLPCAEKPVVAGLLEKNAQGHDFFYGKSYLNSPDAIAFSKLEMPLIQGQRLRSKDVLFRVFSDALPDAWGQRVLLNKYNQTLSLLDLLIFSSSDRIGALHFQLSPDIYQPQYEDSASMEQLMEAVTLVERGQPLPESLILALLHGSSIGGARPKAFIDAENKKYIVKFSASTDIYPIVQAEYAAMSLAKKIGLQVANVKLVSSTGKYMLLVERFDRDWNEGKWARKFLSSALSLLDLNEFQGRYASYLDLADIMRKVCRDSKNNLRELFRRMIFNILIGNTDDHAKNHAFFWDGEYYELTPAYDICPYLRAGQEATQAMQVGKWGSHSTLQNAKSSANSFGLSAQEAQAEIDSMTDAVRKAWPLVCEEARLTKLQQAQLSGSAVLNPYCFFEN